MDEHIPISSFDAVYLIDLCEPLLEIARARFLRRGWTNVKVLCQDAAEFNLPEWENGEDPKGSVGFVTLSYSLSMVTRSISFVYRSKSTSTDMCAFRYPISTPFSTELRTFSRPAMAFSVWSTFTPPHDMPLHTLAQSAERAKNAVGSLDGFGKFGSTSTTSPCLPNGASTWNTNLEPYVILLCTFYLGKKRSKLSCVG